jgi:hypothetical protein
MVPPLALSTREENDMGKSKWLAVAIAASLGTSAVHADTGSRGKMYITPFAGYNHLRIDRGRVFNEQDTLRFDSLQWGVAVGYETPFGLLVEVGRSDALHADIFDEHGDYQLQQTFGAIGWQIDFADGWHLAPRVGRGKWELSSDHRVLLDNAGVRHYEVDGWDNFWEVGLMRQVNPTFSLGVNFKDVDQEFGHSRTGEFRVRFAF